MGVLLAFSATKKHALRVLGRCVNGVRIPALDFASARRMLDQDWSGVNGENIANFQYF